MLNLARRDVQEWLFEWMDQLLAKHNIQYIKWDFNRAISEAGWPEVPTAQQREVYVRHVQALYDIVDRLRHNHPQVLFESCASGGGRVDLGVLSHFDHAWTSDNTDPFDRLAIQQGFSLVYPAKAMFCEVTDMNWNAGSYSLKYRFHVAMLGSLSVGINLNHWSTSQIEEAASYIKTYKRIQATIQEGQLYRLSPFTQTGNNVVEYVNTDQSQVVVLAFQQSRHFWVGGQRYVLQGLDPEALYALSGDLLEHQPTEMSGQALMSYGIVPRFDAYLASALIEINRI
jgi:alpha-galactosidase